MTKESYPVDEKQPEREAVTETGLTPNMVPEASSQQNSGQEALLDKQYQVAFETWRFQVNSYWQRTSYFAAFQTVALAAIWKVSVEGFHGVAAALCIAGWILTRVWQKNDQKTYSYIDYWWKAIIAVEGLRKTTPSEALKLAADYDKNAALWNVQRHQDFRYSKLVQKVPVVFTSVWVFFLVLHLVFAVSDRSQGFHQILQCWRLLPH